MTILYVVAREDRRASIQVPCSVEQAEVSFGCREGSFPDGKGPLPSSKCPPAQSRILVWTPDQQQIQEKLRGAGGIPVLHLEEGQISSY